MTAEGLRTAGYLYQRVVTMYITDPNGATVVTGDSQCFYRVPVVLNGWNLTAVALHVTTVSSSGKPSVQLVRKRSGSDANMLSTVVSCDASELDSSTAAVAGVIDTANDDVNTADELRANVTVSGTGAQGLMLEMTFTKP